MYVYMYINMDFFGQCNDTTGSRYVFFFDDTYAT